MKDLLISDGVIIDIIIIVLLFFLLLFLELLLLLLLLIFLLLLQSLSALVSFPRIIIIAFIIIVINTINNSITITTDIILISITAYTITNITIRKRVYFSSKYSFAQTSIYKAAFYNIFFMPLVTISRFPVVAF